ncbi:MAG: hypothetical protein MR649_08080 [Prevotella sp.]|nr:hypothetical protein [Prevotella sp.]
MKQSASTAIESFLKSGRGFLLERLRISFGEIEGFFWIEKELLLELLR